MQVTKQCTQCGCRCAYNKAHFMSINNRALETSFISISRLMILAHCKITVIPTLSFNTLAVYLCPWVIFITHFIIFHGDISHRFALKPIKADKSSCYCYYYHYYYYYFYLISLSIIKKKNYSEIPHDLWLWGLNLSFIDF